VFSYFVFYSIYTLRDLAADSVILFSYFLKQHLNEKRKDDYNGI